MNIWWIRRDLRLEDNPTLSAALRDGASVLPVFILDERLLAKAAERKRSFLYAGLRELDAGLCRLGAGLIVRRGDPMVELPRVAQEAGASAVFAEEGVSPYACKRDAAIARRLDLHLIHGLSVHPPAAVVRPDGRPYTVFTSFCRAWQALPFDEHPLPPPRGLPPIPELPSVEIPELPAPDDFPAGEGEGKRHLAGFLAGPVFNYAVDRDRLDRDGTAGLSPYIRFGMLSARQAAAAVRQTMHLAPDAPSRAGCTAWLNELIWREFYLSILYHFPMVLKTSFQPSRRGFAWREAPAELLAWQNGLTGYPLVDAGMRQLAATGWMHNRARMITASFLVKHLLIDWREGERWFMRQLIDGEPAANNGGWQWIAGTGTDAAPYFRIFNPVLQGKKCDPEGYYVRRWLPELAGVPTKYIHEPWKMSLDEQRRYRAVINRDYPAPLVEHRYARERALKFYSKSA